MTPISSTQVISSDCAGYILNFGRLLWEQEAIQIAIQTVEMTPKEIASKIYIHTLTHTYQRIILLFRGKSTGDIATHLEFTLWLWIVLMVVLGFSSPPVIQG